MTTKTTSPHVAPNLDAAKKLFIQEVILHRDLMVQMSSESFNGESVEKAKKILHKIKGGVGFFALNEISDGVDAIYQHCKSYPEIDVMKVVSADWKADFDRQLKTFSERVDQLIVAS